MEEFERNEDFEKDEEGKAEEEYEKEEVKTEEEQKKEEALKEFKVVEQKPKKERKFLKFFALILIGALIGGGIGSLITSNYIKNSLPYYSTNINNNETQIVNISKVIELEQSQIIDVAERVSPAVVRISTTQVVSDLFFSYETSGLGSGYLISSDGEIVTNNHVVSDAKKITVTLSDGSEYDATIIGTDPSSDIALIKIDGKDLTYLSFGDSSTLKVGQSVIAIGNPYGLDHTVTTGVISALERSLTFDDGTTLVGVIQTDAAINPGNSGGPLLTLTGDVIGMNTSIQQSAQGIGFAISSSTIIKVISDIKLFGKVVWPFLGISGVSITDDIAKRNNLPTNKGVLIVSVYPGTSAANAGLKSYDIITKFDGNDVTSVQEITKYLRQHNVGDKVKIEIYRDNKKMELEIILMEKPSSIGYNSRYGINI
ncbi:PDZ domain-containing protein [bacterium]|nr:PDZ domain-containing protein [bacterium]